MHEATCALNLLIAEPGQPFYPSSDEEFERAFDPGCAEPAHLRFDLDDPEGLRRVNAIARQFRSLRGVASVTVKSSRPGNFIELACNATLRIPGLLGDTANLLSAHPGCASPSQAQAWLRSVEPDKMLLAQSLLRSGALCADLAAAVPDPGALGAELAEACAWIAKHSDIPLSKVPPLSLFGPESLAAVSETPESARHCLFAKFQSRPDSKIAPGDLDRATAELAKTRPRLAASHMPPALAWPAYFGRPMPDGAEAHPHRFPLQAYERICERLGADPFCAEPGEQTPLRLCASRLARLFRADADAAIRLIDACGEAPQTQEPHPGIRRHKQWAALCCRHPELLARAGLFFDLEQCNGGAAPATLAEFRKLHGALLLKTVDGAAPFPGLQRLADLFMQYSIAPSSFPAAAKLAACPKKQCLMPEAGLVSDTGNALTKLSAGDPLALLAGYASGCCQHLFGAARTSVLHSWTSPHSATYAFCSPGGALLAQFWAWRSACGAVVIDSIESALPEPQLDAALRELCSLLDRWKPGCALYLGTRTRLSKRAGEILGAGLAPTPPMADAGPGTAIYTDTLAQSYLISASLPA